jgi:hypothetical protein
MAVRAKLAKSLVADQAAVNFEVMVDDGVVRKEPSGRARLIFTHKPRVALALRI